MRTQPEGFHHQSPACFCSSISLPGASGVVLLGHAGPPATDWEASSAIHWSELALERQDAKVTRMRRCTQCGVWMDEPCGDYCRGCKRRGREAQVELWEWTEGREAG